MPRDPLVSVFMPTYNHEQYIADSIESVLAQEYGNYEIVVCDDHSSDSTPRIVAEYGRLYPDKIKVLLNERNIGITPTFNRILNECSGKYIAFTSGDDLFLPGKLQRQVEIMERDESVVMSYHNVEIFHSGSGHRISLWHDEGSPKTSPVVGNAHDVVRHVVSRTNAFMSGQSIMVRRDRVPDNAYEIRLLYLSDWFFWVEFLVNAQESDQCVYFPDVLSKYRRHDSNITNEIEFDYDDWSVVLALVESRYPWLIAEVERSRARMRFKRAVRFIRKMGNRSLGRKYLRYCFARVQFSSSYLKWYIKSFL